MTIEIKFFRQILVFALAAALMYGIAVSFYIRQQSFESSYILYIGNFLFAAVIGVFISWFYKKHERDIGTISLVVAGAKTAALGIACACLICLLLLLVLVPDVFKSSSSGTIALASSPAQFMGKNQGFGFILFINAVLGNAGASFFISLLIPFSVMKNLYPDEKRKSGTGSEKEENPKKNYNL